MRQAFVFRGEDGYWVAEAPSLPGCVSQGRSKEEAIEGIKEAIALYIESLESENRPIPADGFEAILVAV
jgi:predicted RNase H-like HicB family nuclease